MANECCKCVPCSSALPSQGTEAEVTYAEHTCHCNRDQEGSPVTAVSNDLDLPLKKGNERKAGHKLRPTHFKMCQTFPDLALPY